MAVDLGSNLSLICRKDLLHKPQYKTNVPNENQTVVCYLVKAAHFRRQHHICKLKSSKDSNTTPMRNYESDLETILM